MDVYMMRTRDAIRNEVSKVKTYIIKEMDNKFAHIINLIKKSW